MRIFRRVSSVVFSEANSWIYSLFFSPFYIFCLIFSPTVIFDCILDLLWLTKVAIFILNFNQNLRKRYTKYVTASLQLRDFVRRILRQNITYVVQVKAESSTGLELITYQCDEVLDWNLLCIMFNVPLLIKTFIRLETEWRSLHARFYNPKSSAHFIWSSHLLHTQRDGTSNVKKLSHDVFPNVARRRYPI